MAFRSSEDFTDDAWSQIRGPSLPDLRLAGEGVERGSGGSNPGSAKDPTGMNGRVPRWDHPIVGCPRSTDRDQGREKRQRQTLGLTDSQRL